MGAITEERAVSALFLLSPPPPPSTPSSIYSSSTPPEQCVHAKGLTTQGITNTSVRMSVCLWWSRALLRPQTALKGRENISYCSCVCCVFFFFLPYFSKNSVACGNSLRRLCNYQFNRALWLLSEAQVNFRVVAKY